jgi:hypothetical protein
LEENLKNRMRNKININKQMGLISALLILTVFLLSSCTSVNKSPEVSGPPATRLLIQQDGYYGYINEKGEVAIAPIFDHALNFSEGYAYVEIGKKHFFINTKGDLALLADLKGADEASYFSDGLASVSFGGFNYGYIDKKGNLAIPADYFPASSFSEGLAAVSKDGWGFIDKTGKIVIPLQYADAFSFSEGLAAVTDQNNQRSYIDQTGKTVISLPVDYMSALGFSEGLAAVQGSNNKWGYIDKTGKLVIGLNYFGAGGFQEGLASVGVNESVTGAMHSGEEDKFNHNCGYIDKSGNLIIPAMFSECAPFSEGLALVTIGKSASWFQGFIDKSGNWAIPAQFDTAHSFQSGLAYTDLGYINKQGEFIWKNK